MKDIVADPELVAKCGLYCGACGAYLHGRCPGCAGNHKATWCKARACCLERNYATCADCGDHAAFEDCGKLHNFISKTISFFTRSDRPGSLRRIKQAGRAAYAAEMAAARAHSIKRK
jgi:hypothetical protein